MSEAQSSTASGAQSAVEVPSGLHSNQLSLALETVGDRWILLIMRDAFTGVKLFDEFHRRTGAPRSTLASRLDALVAEGILYRNPYCHSPLRHEYRITGKGLELYAFALAAWAWEMDWSKRDDLPPRVQHLACGNEMHPKVLCAECGGEVHLEDCSFSSKAIHGGKSHLSRHYQRRSRRSVKSAASNKSFFQTADVVGDRWTSLIVSAAMFGVSNFDGFIESLGIATNILSDRLTVLSDHDVLVRRALKDQPSRSEYFLTEKGKGLFPVLMLLAQWGDKWMFRDISEHLEVRHESCGAPLKCQVVCDVCTQPVDHRHVNFLLDPRT